MVLRKGTELCCFWVHAIPRATQSYQLSQNQNIHFWETKAMTITATKSGLILTNIWDRASQHQKWAVHQIVRYLERKQQKHLWIVIRSKTDPKLLKPSLQAPASFANTSTPLYLLPWKANLTMASSDFHNQCILLVLTAFLSVTWSSVQSL